MSLLECPQCALLGKFCYLIEAILCNMRGKLISFMIKCSINVMSKMYKIDEKEQNTCPNFWGNIHLTFNSSIDPKSLGGLFTAYWILSAPMTLTHQWSVMVTR